jgi:uncharacterized membrane protein
MISSNSNSGSGSSKLCRPAGTHPFNSTTEYLGWLHVGATSLAFLDYSWVRWILTVLALGELVTDQLPSTPSRTVPVQFAGRIVTGALSGAKIGVSSGSLIVGADHGAPFRAIHPFLVTPSGP